MKKKRYYIHLIIALTTFCRYTANAQSVGVGTITPDAYAILDVTVPDSVNNPQGMLLPRLPQKHINDLALVMGAAQVGMIVYNLDSNCVEMWDGAAWDGCGGGGGGSSDDGDWTDTGAGDLINTTHMIGIGVSNPVQNLEVAGDVIFGGGSTSHDGTGEFIQIEAQSDSWYIGVQNETSANLSDFYIGLGSTQDGTFLIENTGDVGIGLNTPVAKLHIHDAVNTSTTFKITHSGISSATTSGWDFQLNSTSANILLRENLPMNFGTNSANAMQIGANGNMSVGSMGTNTKLRVSGGLAVDEYAAGAGTGSISPGDQTFISIEGGGGKMSIDNGVQAGQLLIILNNNGAVIQLDEADGNLILMGAGTTYNIGTDGTATFIWSLTKGGGGFWVQIAGSENN